MKESLTPWIMAYDGTVSGKEFGFGCERCGAKLPVGTPTSIDNYVANAEAFIKRHAKCRPVAAPPLDVIAPVHPGKKEELQ